MSGLPELWILRHGQTEWNAEERLQGRLDSPLTPLGLRQARAQGAILRRVLPGHARVLCSPASRAWRTAKIALADLALRPEPAPALQEIDLGRWQGRTVAEIRGENPHLPADDPHLWKFDAPGGESLPQMEARLKDLLHVLTGPTVLVTHGVTSRVLRCLALGRPGRELSQMPGGQGVVHHLWDGRARVLQP